MRDNLLSYTQDLLDKNLPFLLLRTANDTTVRVLSQRDQKWHKKAHDKLAYGVFSKFQNTEDQIFITGEDDKSFTFEKRNFERSKLLNATCIVDKVEQDRYTKLVQKAVDHLKQSSLKKVVLSRKQTFKKNKTDLEILNDLLQHYPAANCYFFYHPQIGKWMGATPEVLVNITGQKLKTMSLAGTAVYVKGEEHSWGNKEKEEQQLVTDFIIENLHKTGAVAIKNSQVETVRAGNLIHLRTDISATIKTGQNGIYINALHPTPAVCGIPRNEAFDFIKNEENYDRSFYTGYVGIVDQSSSSYFVNLRCMQLYEKEVAVYVGGGITELSNPEQEYIETVNKLDTMRKLL